jgi:hypothetical protein
MNETGTDEITTVWWVSPHGDKYQHATAKCPPHEGGPVQTLGGSTVEAPPAGAIRLHPFRPFCHTCLMEFLCLRRPAMPLWTY